MIKKNKSKVSATIELPDIAPIVAMYSELKNPEKTELESQKVLNESSIELTMYDIERYRLAISEDEKSIESRRERISRIDEKLAALPIVSVDETAIEADIAKLSRLAWIDKVEIVLDGDHESLTVKTRPNALFTKMVHKVDSDGPSTVATDPYTIALPAYEIRLALRAFGSLSNDTERLSIRLADSNDYAHFDDIGWCNQEIHAHWATRGGTGHQGVCLGEYEGEVTQAFKRSLYEGLTSFAEYLQTAGAENAFVSGERGKIKWALYLGKKEYNESCIFSSNDVSKAQKELEAIGLKKV